MQYCTVSQYPLFSLGYDKLDVYVLIDMKIDVSSVNRYIGPLLLVRTLDLKIPPRYSKVTSSALLRAQVLK